MEECVSLLKSLKILSVFLFYLIALIIIITVFNFLLIFIINEFKIPNYSFPIIISIWYAIKMTRQYIKEDDV